MDQDTIDQVIVITDGLERNLRPVYTFITEKIVDKVGGDIAGPVVDVPQKVVGLGPIVLRQLGQGPGDEPFDTLVDLQQGLDVNFVPLPNQPPHHNRVVIEIDRGPDGPHAPNADTVVDEQFDP